MTTDIDLTKSDVLKNMHQYSTFTFTGLPTRQKDIDKNLQRFEQTSNHSL